ncbi:SlyX family protein [Schlesneria paludicola]|uniref:SlyX family protein n=1 Tax=Schlesneria paludicola TaxID=360056 RepID=UPI000299DD37|nr:SlyX family protein [Schlesneria paludicola]
MTAPDVSQQIIDLQMTVAHLEHDLAQMHHVLLAVQADLKGMRDQMAKLERRVVQASEPAEQRDPNDERPPHY